MTPEKPEKPEQTDSIKPIATVLLFGINVSIYGTIENPLFIAREIAEILKIDNTSTTNVLRGIPGSEKLKSQIATSGQVRSTFMITERGLYRLVLRSHSPMAIPFQEAVMDILQDIRRHGVYVAPALRDDPDAMVLASLEYLKAKFEASEAARKAEVGRLERINLLQDQLLLEQTKELEAAKDDVSYCDMVRRDKVNYRTVTQLSKDYGMGPVKFNQMLYELGIQYPTGEGKRRQWVLYSKYQAREYATGKEYTTDKNGVPLKSVQYHTVWLRSGIFFLYQLLKHKKNLVPVMEREINRARAEGTNEEEEGHE